MYKTIANIEGMMCGMCEAHIQDAIRKLPGVKRVKASHSKNQVKILTPSPLTLDELHTVIDPTGYRLVSAESKIYEKKGFFAFLFF